MTTPESQGFRDTLAADLVCTPKEERKTLLEIAKESGEYQEAKKEKLQERQDKAEAGGDQTLTMVESAHEDSISRLKLSREDGKERRTSHAALVEWGVPIGRGAYADVSREEIVVNKFGKERARTMAMKTYRGGDAPEVTRKAYENYLMCKKAGLKVLPTMRIDEENKDRLVMTDWSENDAYAVFSANEIGSPTRDEAVDAIQNIHELATTMAEQAKKATIAGIYLTNDAFMFRFKRGGHLIKLEVAVVDMDLPYQTAPRFKEFEESLYEWNSARAKDALEHGISRLPLSYTQDYSQHQLRRDEKTALSTLTELLENRDSHD